MMGRQSSFWANRAIVTDRSNDGKGGDKEGELKTVPKIMEQIEKEISLREQDNKRFVWDCIDVEDDAQLSELYAFLRDHYVEGHSYRFRYSKEMLRYSLTPPGHRKEFNVCLRFRATKSLVAFLSAVPATVRAHDKVFKTAEANYFCIDRRFRSQSLSPLMLSKLISTVGTYSDITTSLCTSGAELMPPLSVARYHHRQLNVKKMVEIGFTRLPSYMKDMDELEAWYALPDKIELSLLNAGRDAGSHPQQHSSSSGTGNKSDGGGETTEIEKKKKGKIMRPMTASARDISGVTFLLNWKLERRKLAPVFTKEDVKHWFVPRENVVYTFVVEEEETGKITDVTSYYCVYATVLNNEKHKQFGIAFSFYHAACSMPLKVLIRQAMITAKQNGLDVYNCLNVMGMDRHVFEYCRFKAGTGFLKYYLYNWRCDKIDPSDLGLILL